MTVVDRTLEQAAIDLAEAGYHVFPCRPGDKTPITRNGFKDATRDERQILQWWDRTPDANIGIACGASGVTVLDIDSKSGANPTEILSGRDLHGAPIVLTGKAPPRDDSHPDSLPDVRGVQVYFRGELPTGPLPIPGCEIRGAGAYVVAPGSTHPSGVRYTGQLPPAARLPEVPAWLCDLAAPAHRNGNGPAPAVTDTIAAGRRNAELASIAGTMRRRGLGATEIAAALAVTNRERCQPPLPPEEVEQIAHSIARYPPADAGGKAHAIAVTNADAGEAMRALGELLALDSVSVTVTAARVYGRGSGASLEIDVSNGETLTFGTLREMMRPQALIAEVAACTGATPAIKQVQCAQALTLARAAAEYVEVDTENDIAREWGRDFLQLAETLDLDITDQAQRWHAFGMLAGRDPWSSHRSPDDDQSSGVPLVLRHEDGARYVRTVWFERYVKARDSSVSRTIIGPRMARVGWAKRGRQGDIKATAVGRNETKTFPFWIVPNGWEDRP